MKKSVLSQQKKIIIILASLAALLAVIYAAIAIFAKDPVNTVLRYDEDGDELYATFSGGSGGEVTTSLINGLLESGERSKYDVKPGQTENIAYTFRAPNVTIKYRPFIIPEIPLDELESVTVENSSGKYTVLRSGEDGDFTIVGAENVPCKSSELSNLLLQARYMLSVQKVETPSDKLSDYGLAESDNPIKITVSDSDGEIQTVLLGSRSLSGSSYYMKHYEKPYIYVMDSSAEVFEKGVEYFLSPVIENSISENEYSYIDSFEMKKNGAQFIKCEIIPEEQRGGTSSTDLHKMTYPAEYSPSITNFYEALSYLRNPAGNAVVAYGVSKKTDKERIFEYYGLTVPSNEVEYSYNGESFRFITGNSFTDEAGNKYYYTYSELMDTIVTLPLSSMPVLEYNLLDFIDESVFRCSIDNVTSISFSTPAGTKTFDLSGSKNDLAVTERLSGKQIDAQSFRQLFIKLLSIKIEGYSDVTDTSSLNRDLSFTVKTKYEEEITYSFYTLSTIRCFMTINGSGEFYVNRSHIDKISAAIDMLMNGTIIQADY